jgi:exodeoxyribonuclease VII large subunit
LEDATGDALISFRLWSSTLQRLPDDLRVGNRVVACVKSDYFMKSGDFTFTVSAMRHTGLGDQLARLEQLRAQLRREGLFDESRKKRLPFLPHVIGLITGERSDAEKDVHRNAELRWPQVRFRTAHVAVQGERCVPETLAALATLDADPEVDVIVIARGGGDPQTLLGFNDERLLRAVAAASTPIVSAIGHENDHPLLDDVADLRASTPTSAARCRRSPAPRRTPRCRSHNRSTSAPTCSCASEGSVASVASSARACATRSAVIATCSMTSPMPNSLTK